MSLRLASVSAGYRGRAVFEDADLHVAGGEVLGLIGPNGAGKTTMLRVAAGLIRPAGGSVSANGALMYFGGEATLPGGCRADRWAGLFGTAAQTRRPIARLSRGTRQLLGLTTHLTRHDWMIGLLDEPWEGLDPSGSRWLTDTLRAHRNRGAALVISSHRLYDAADVCSAYAFLAKGVLRVVAPSELSRDGARVGAADLARAFDEFTSR